MAFKVRGLPRGGPNDGPRKDRHHGRVYDPMRDADHFTCRIPARRSGAPLIHFAWAKIFSTDALIGAPASFAVVWTMP